MLAVISNVRLRDLDVIEVDNALAAVAATRSTSPAATAHLALAWAITRARAQAKNPVLRNVSTLTGAPPGVRMRRYYPRPFVHTIRGF